jgi:hypothetical protein
VTFNSLLTPEHLAYKIFDAARSDRRAAHSGNPFRTWAIDGADQKRLAQNAAAKLKRARTEGEQDLSNLATRLDKMPRK